MIATEPLDGPSTTQELEHEYDGGDDEKNMNEAAEDLPGYESEQPEHQQNHENCPQHDISPPVCSWLQ